MNEINEIEDHLEDMSEDTKTEDYEVGYGKPPKSGRFEKGVSGNPSGRPRKPTDPDSEWRRELSSKVPAIENGKRKLITRSAAYKRQTTNKAIQGNAQAIQVVREVERGLQERTAEQQQNSKPELDWKKVKPRDLSDDDLLLIAAGQHPAYPPCKCMLDNQSGLPRID
jgi:Family of unknown function (DUF5681)